MKQNDELDILFYAFKNRITILKKSKHRNSLDDLRKRGFKTRDQISIWTEKEAAIVDQALQEFDGEFDASQLPYKIAHDRLKDSKTTKDVEKYILKKYNMI